MTAWDGGTQAAEQTLPVPGSEVARLGLIVDCMEAGDDAERRRHLAWLSDRYGPTPVQGRRSR